MLARKMLPTAGAGNKVAKAGGFRKLVEEGRVWLPLGRAWAEELVEECLSFPSGAHDDFVDVGSLFGRAMQDMANGPMASVREERDAPLTPFTYEWHERMLAMEKAGEGDRRARFE